MNYVGIDPGKSGGIALVSDKKKLIKVYKMPKTEHETAKLIFYTIPEFRVERIGIENINGWMGKFLPSSRMFTMGVWYGGPLFVSYLTGYPVKKVMAHKWQRDLGLDAKKDHPKDWKKYLHSKACEFFPDQKIPAQCGDAVLIAYWLAMKGGEKK